MEKRLTVWRVQNEFGFGPYNGKGNIFAFICANMTHGKRRPAPWQDKDLSKVFTNHVAYLRQHWLRSGFQDVDQYHGWFNGSMRNVLDATGFFLTRYSVPEKDILVGDKQCIFALRHSKITAFRRCNQPGIMTARDEIQHTPIKHFLRAANAPLVLAPRTRNADHAAPSSPPSSLGLPVPH